MATLYVYYVVEDRVYRAPAEDPRRMEKWTPGTRSWERYGGDFAAVIINGTNYGTRRPPELTR